MKVQVKTFHHDSLPHCKCSNFDSLVMILSLLGVEPGVLANLASPDPRTRNMAFAAVGQTLSQDPDGPFDATIPVPGLGPGIPGASGHAAAYEEGKLGVPVILLSGFDVDESHVATEEIDYGDPTVTATDVVDRETLRAFVTQAGNYYRTLAEQLGGEMIEMQEVMLPANGQTAMFISELFDHDTSDFTGSMRCTAPPGTQHFTGVAVELDPLNGIFTTLPVIPLSEGASPDEEMMPEE